MDQVKDICHVQFSLGTFADDVLHFGPVVSPQLDLDRWVVSTSLSGLYIPMGEGGDAFCDVLSELVLFLRHHDGIGDGSPDKHLACSDFDLESLPDQGRR
ncbi:hypothetical protein RBB50_003847 [Rhinocladiella similis]